MKQQFDCTYLGQGAIFSTNSKENGVNNNELIIGGTQTGKTTSVVEPKLLYAQYSSYVIPLVKRTLIQKYEKSLRNKGYLVWDLNITNAYQSDIGVDLFDYIQSDEDYYWLAKQLVGNMTIEEFWNNTAINVLTAEMVFLKCKLGRVQLLDLLMFHNSIELDTSKSFLKTSVDDVFKDMMNQYPDNFYLSNWKMIYENAPKTAACIFSNVSNCLKELANENIIELANKNKRIQIDQMGDIRTVLFITTSPVDVQTTQFMNILYTLLFKTLFKKAQSLVRFRLNVPIQIVCDDFACGSKIPDIERYISIFSSTGIGVTLLLQSISQLNSMYNENAANTILNNCDTVCYTGGMDVSSCQLISRFSNRPFEEILNLSLGNIIIIRRGGYTFFTKRYAIYETTAYKEMMQQTDQILEI